MGSALSQEQQTHLEAFRASVIELVTIALEKTPIEDTDASHACLTTGKAQVELISEMMLIAFATAWYDNCLPLYEMAKQGITLQQFLDEILALDMDLPGSGSFKDFHRIAASVDQPAQLKMLEQFVLGMDHIRNSGIKEHNFT